MCQKFCDLLADMKKEFFEMYGEFSNQLEAACPRRAPKSPKGGGMASGSSRCKAVPDISAEVFGVSTTSCEDKASKITEVVDEEWLIIDL